jgi:hypothetical protein
MADLAHWWSNDLSAGPAGDLLPVDGAVRGQQRVLRRLLTVPGSYIWHPEYGAGLQLYIGEAVDPSVIEAVVRAQIALEAAVLQTPDPEIIVQQIPNGVWVRIIYTDAETGLPVTLSFDVNQ